MSECCLLDRWLGLPEPHVCWVLRSYVGRTTSATTRTVSTMTSHRNARKSDDYSSYRNASKIDYEFDLSVKERDYCSSLCQDAREMNYWLLLVSDGEEKTNDYLLFVIDCE